jgi:hypothetical protein
MVQREGTENLANGRALGGVSRSHASTKRCPICSMPLSPLLQNAPKRSLSRIRLYERHFPLATLSTSGFEHACAYVFFPQIGDRADCAPSS